jgi:hypothetical protein
MPSFGTHFTSPIAFIMCLIRVWLVSDGFHKGKDTTILVWGLRGFLAVKLTVREVSMAPTVRFIGVKLADNKASG